MYLTVGSLIDITNITTGSNYITLRKVNIGPYGYDVQGQRFNRR